MLALNDRLPRYLLEKEQIWTTVVYTALFSLVFILVSIPFSGSAWFALGESEAFIYTLAFILLSALLIILSRALMHRCRDLAHFTLLGYVILIAGYGGAEARQPSHKISHTYALTTLEIISSEMAPRPEASEFIIRAAETLLMTK